MMMTVAKAIAVLGATFTAIAVHALTPSEVPVEAFDSFLVSVLGFAFALLYFFGMQEVVVEPSPFTEWGLPFVWFQVLLGLADAIPTVLLCIVVSYCTPRRASEDQETPAVDGPRQVKMIALIAALFVLVRTVGYETGIVVSNVDTFPLPSYGWTVIFGVVLGCSYVLLYPFFATESRPLSVTIRLAGLALGLNWMIFNGFIGMIFSETMGQALLRSGLDVVALAIASILITRFPDRGRTSVARA